MSTGISRRFFLKAAVATTGGLMLGMDSRSFAAGSAVNETGSWQPDIWLEIHPDNRIQLTVARVEMGQGALTGLVTLIAEELDVAPEKISTLFAPADKAYNNPDYGLQMTGGSNSLSSSWMPMRQAGASARTMLIAAAADKWQINRSSCTTENGFVLNQSTGNRLSYGELAALAARQSPPANPSLKAASELRYIGKDFSRVDALAKSNGTAKFGIDVSLPDMLHAVIIRPPAYGSKLKSFDSREALASKGVMAVFEIDQGLAIVAEKYWQAHRARQQVKVEWRKNDDMAASLTSVYDRYSQDIAKKGDVVRKEGNIRKAMKGASSRLEVEYRLPFLAHATMEPQNCVASVTGDQCIIWAPNQAPDTARAAAARATGIDQKNIQVHTTFMGGGFGRRLTPDFVEEAAAVSKRMNKPVKVLWSREDDTRHDWYRPATLHRLAASFDANRQPTGWSHKIAGPKVLDWYIDYAAPAMYPGISKWMYSSVASYFPDKTCYEGAEELPYDLSSIQVEHCHSDAGVPISYWRSVGHSHNGFVTESFIDELAHASGADAYEFRYRLLQEQPRGRKVLKMVAEKAGWGQPASDVWQGIAIHKSFGTWVAQVADVRVTAGQFRVEKVTCVVDCGVAVNPDIVRAQMESGIVFGLTAALYGEITLKDGAVEQGNFHDYQVLRMNECPEMDIHIIDSEEAPSGVGEPGLPPLAPAVANALYAATGKRLRSLPLQLSQS
ncbi:MAG: molybdopterin cofactor-binding domain-containing protein [Endozoicomonas sp.]